MSRSVRVNSELLGLYLGYPLCCSMSFGFEHTALTYKEKTFPLEGTGFVPCPHCASTKSAVQLRTEIARRRYCTTPFDTHYTPHLDYLKLKQVKRVLAKYEDVLSRFPPEDLKVLYTELLGIPYPLEEEAHGQKKADTRTPA